MTLTEGQKLGAFEIIDVLGVGGMGEVYRARDTRLGREVAIKVLGVFAEVDETQVMRFEREARFLASLDHPNIAGIYDFQEFEGTKFLVMQLVEGPTLAEQLKKGPLPLREALLIFAQIAEALDAAHKRDIIHRDLKPANLKITPDARVKVLDFGLAKLSSAEPSSGGLSDYTMTIPSLSATREGQIIGTPAYMSPEQARGFAVDRRADIWSFGCILYESLTGKRPFFGGTISDLVASVLRAEPDWTLLPREVPSNIVALMQRCLAKDRDDRLPDIGEARLEIDRALTMLSSTRHTASSAGTTSSPSTESVLKIMMFTELVDSVGLKTHLGDLVGAELIGRHDEAFRLCLSRCRGTEVDNAGEGFFCVFERASDALDCALDFQMELSRLESPVPLMARIGIHMGEIVRLRRSTRDGGPAKYVGLAIDAASRITGLAEPRQILLTRAAFDAARQQVAAAPSGEPIQWLAHGSYVIRGLEEPVEIFEAGIAGFSPLIPPTGSERAQRLVRPDEEDTLGWRPATDLPIPGRVNWILREPLGEGGFGEVWLAEQSKTHEKRVFKFCFQADRVRALKHEVVLFRLLKESLGDRRDIIRILDWKFDEPPFYIESEFTNGGSLVQWAESQGGIDAVPLNLRLQIAADVADALSAAHSVGVLHKDLKPANILIENASDGRPPRALLTDFGIGLVTDRGLLQAKGITTTGLGLTQTMFAGDDSSGAGTRLYMAPEVIEGRPATMQSDIYSLGIVLYQLITGNFVRALAPGWERDIEDSLLREDIASCVDGRPDRRLSSAAELSSRLRQVEERHARIEAELRTREEAALAKRLAEEARIRRRQYLFASGVGLLLLAAVASFAFQETRRATSEAKLRSEAEVARGKEREARVLAERSQALSERLKEKAEAAQYVSNIQMATVRLEQGEKDLAREALIGTPERVRNWEWGYLVDEAWPVQLEQPTKSILERPDGRSSARLWSGANGRVAAILSGHTGFVVALEFSADGKRLATGSGDRTARIWDTESGRLLTTLQGESTILDVAFSHDGKLLVTGELVEAVTIWDSVTGEKLRRLAGEPESVDAVIFSPDDRYVASHSISGLIHVWDMRTGELSRVIHGPPPGKVRQIALSTDGEVTAACNGGDIKSWSTKNGSTTFESAKFGAPGFDLVAFDRSGNMAASQNSKGRVVVWNLDRADPLVEFEAGPNGSGNARVEFSPDHTVAATIGDDHVVRIWDIGIGKKLVSIPDVQLPSMGRLRFSPEGSRLAIPDKSGRVLIFAPSHLAGERLNVIRAHDDLVYILRFSPDGKTLLSLSYDKTIKLWDLKTGLQEAALRGHTAEPGFVSWSRDGRKILTGAWDRTSRIWDVASGKELLRKDIGLPGTQFAGGPRGPVFRVIAANTPSRLFTPDGQRFLALTEKPGGIGMYDTGTGQPYVEFQTPTGVGFYPYHLSPDGRSILTVDFPTGIARLWDASTGAQRFALEGHKGMLTHADFSRDGRLISTTSVDGTTKIWDAATGKLQHTLTGHQIYCNSASFSPSGRWIVTASHDQTAKIWDVGSGVEVATLVGHKRDVINAEFSPDESRILTTGQDNALKLWDIEGHELLTITCDTEICQALWSPNGSEIVAALADGTIRFWISPRWSELKALADADAPLEKRLALWRSR